MAEASEKPTPNVICPPDWYVAFVSRVVEDTSGLEEEIKIIGEMPLAELEARIGGRITELPYDFLQTIFPDGSGDESVAVVLRTKREAYLQTHPEAKKSKDVRGVNGFDGRFWPQEQFDRMTDSEKIGVMVGSTCFHYGSETPKMTSEPSDFLPKD